MRNKLTKTTRRSHEVSSRNDKTSRLPVILAVMIIRLVLNMTLISTAYAMPPYTDNGLAKVSGKAFANSYYLDNKALLLDQGVDAPGDLLTKQKTGEGWVKASVSGSLNILTILVDFSDLATNVLVTGISNSGSNMTADLAVGIPQSVEDDDYIIPEKAQLHQNYPNPFNSNTNISFILQQATNVEITIFDIGGRLVREVFSGYLETGIHTVNWNGIDVYANMVSSGIYFYSLSIGDNRLHRNMLYLKYVVFR